MFSFDLYIGENMFYGQDKKIIAVVVPNFDIPASQYNLSGNVITKDKNQYFASLVDLKNYFCDWLELLDNKVQIKTKVYLNILSLSRVFKGDKVVQLIDKLDSRESYSEIRSFSEIL